MMELVGLEPTASWVRSGGCCEWLVRAKPAPRAGPGGHEAYVPSWALPRICGECADSGTRNGPSARTIQALRAASLTLRKPDQTRSVAAVVGAPSTPRPRGASSSRRACHARWAFALALSARSNVLQEFEGGPGQIALHGLANLGGRPGTAASHGCVRLANSNIRWMVGRITPGVPTTITR